MIIRSEKNGNYTILPNELLLDETISDKARGLLVRLLARPDNWKLNVNHLIKTGKGGQVTVRSSLKELESVGYIRSDVVRHDNGRIIEVEYIVSDHIVDVNNMVELTDDDVDHVDHISNVGNMVEEQEDHIVDSHDMEIHIKETANKQTEPITNTEIKQILKETTTTAPSPCVCSEDVPLSSSSFPSGILNLIPERHRSPIVLTLVNKAMSDCSENELKKAILYSASNVRGGSNQFRAYLDKTIKNKWADGWEPGPEKSADRQAAGEQFRNLPIGTLKMLADVGNVVAMEELKRRDHGICITTAGKRQYARA